MSKRLKKLSYENIPEWAIYFLEYGDDDGLTEKEVDELINFTDINFPVGYTMSVQWDNFRDFDSHPAFGLPCKTYHVDFYVN